MISFRFVFLFAFVFLVVSISFGECAKRSHAKRTNLEESKSIVKRTCFACSTNDQCDTDQECVRGCCFVEFLPAVVTLPALTSPPPVVPTAPPVYY